MFTDLENLPLTAVDTRKTSAKLKAGRDENASEASGIRSCKGNKVRVFIKCYECSKKHRVYAKTDEGYWRNRTTLKQNWRRWPNSFVVVTFSLVTAIH